MLFFWKRRQTRSTEPVRRWSRLSLEELEARVVLYAATSNIWPHPELISLSFVPDGTLMASGTGGTYYSSMFSKFNSRWDTATWQDQILSAAQLWAQAANINFTVVSDNGTAEGQGSYQQGDPGMGDIRIGSYAMSTNYLGMAYLPPPVNNYSIAGDFSFNSAQTYNINGSAYDMQSVALHEMGHALGLMHSTTYYAAMYASYNLTKHALNSDDIAGIQSIYGARQPDPYEGLLGNNSFLTADVLTSLLDPLSLTAQLTNADITTTSDVDYYAFVAPLGTSGNLTVNVQSAGLSLLRPSVTVYAADQSTVLGSATASSDSYTGSTLSVTSSISPLQLFYVKVSGADTTQFGTGRYALTVNLGSGPTPTVTPPNTQTLNGTVLSGGSGQAERSHESVDSSSDDSSDDEETSDNYSINDAVEERDDEAYARLHQTGQAAGQAAAALPTAAAVSSTTLGVDAFRVVTILSAQGRTATADGGPSSTAMTTLPATASSTLARADSAQATAWLTVNFGQDFAHLDSRLSALRRAEAEEAPDAPQPPRTSPDGPELEQLDPLAPAPQPNADVWWRRDGSDADLARAQDGLFERLDPEGSTHDPLADWLRAAPPALAAPWEEGSAQAQGGEAGAAGDGGPD